MFVEGVMSVRNDRWGLNDLERGKTGKEITI